MNRAFAFLWTGQTCSVVASSFATLAIPSVGILALHATPWQVGMLEALETVAFPLIGLPVGVLVDRWPRRRILACANAGRAMAVASIPVAAHAGSLSIAFLAAVATVVGVLNVFFGVAYQAVLPEVVDGPDLPRANARLEISQSLSQAVGNGGGGALVGLVGGPLALAAVACGYALSALALINLPARAVASAARRARTSFLEELREGWRAVFATRGLPQLIGSTATSNLGSSIGGAAYLLFAYRSLHLAPATIGIVFVCGEIGFVGAILAPRLGARFGFARTLVAAQILSSGALAIVPFAQRSWSLANIVALLVASQLVLSCAIPVYNILTVSYRQGAVAPALQGRVNATARTLLWGTLPIGSACGGLLAGRIGFAPTLAAGAAITLCATAWLATPVVRRIVFAAHASSPGSAEIDEPEETAAAFAAHRES